MIDFAAWVVPLVCAGGDGSRVGLADRFVPYMVATNWASGMVAWMTVPPVILATIFPAGGNDAAALLWLSLFVASLMLVWRLTNAVLGKGARIATALFAAMIAVSAVVYGLDFLLGIPSRAVVRRSQSGVLVQSG